MVQKERKIFSDLCTNVQTRNRSAPCKKGNPWTMIMLINTYKSELPSKLEPVVAKKIYKYDLVKYENI